MFHFFCPSQNGYINLSGFITPKQTDTLVRYVKEEGNKWFTKIQSVVKNESKNIEVSTNVILTEISVYNVR